MGRWFISASRGNSNFLAAQWLISLVFRIFGVSDMAARLVSVTASVATVAVVYVIARRLYESRRDALFASLVLAVSGYTVMLGRLALLDATACFAIVVAIYCLVRWCLGSPTWWLAPFVIAAMFAVEVKVTSVLLLPIAVGLIVVTGAWRRLTLRKVCALVVVGLVAAAPAIAQVIDNTGGLRDYLSASTRRTSGVSWNYYLGVLWSAEGMLLAVVLLLGVVLAVVRHQRADALPLIWFLCYAAFLQLYPLKGFNYLLPLMPPLALMAGRGLGWLVDRLHSVLRLGSVTVPALLAIVVVASQAGAVHAAVDNDRSAGMREAAVWLKAHGAARAGTLALSHGSGQYALSFYGGIDAYPYGRFRIATVMPGGVVVKARPRVGGKVPLDWVDYWPARLIEEGRIAFLVYQTRPLDDPPDQSDVAGSITEKQFRSLIAHYGGQLVHTVYWHHEARVYVYKVTQRLPGPTLDVRPTVGLPRNTPTASVLARPAHALQAFRVMARGFAFDSPVSLRFHGVPVGRAVTDSAGRATLTVRVPVTGRSEYHLIARDREGNSASITGVSPTRLTYVLDRTVVRVTGVGFLPGRAVTLTYRNSRLGSVSAGADGSVAFAFRIPARTHARFRITASGVDGRTAFTTGLSAPYLAFVTTGRHVTLTGRNFSASSRLSVTLAGRRIAITRSDAQGNLHLALRLPARTRPVIGWPLSTPSAAGPPSWG